jgi:hypothetical protein
MSVGGQCDNEEVSAAIVAKANVSLAGRSGELGAAPGGRIVEVMAQIRDELGVGRMIR